MLFNSPGFLAFFPAVVLARYLAPRAWIGTVLLAAGYIFYAVPNPAHLVLLPLVGGVTYLAARQIEVAVSPSSRRRWMLLATGSILGLLGVFKYWNFASTALTEGLAQLGLGVRIPTLDLALPVGISFFTLQAVAYVADVYIGKYRAERSLSRTLLFVSYFPLLVAGPIERADTLMPQLPGASRADTTRITTGFRLMLWGFFKKIVVADRLAGLVGVAYDGTLDANGLVCLLATYAFAIQIYCDFSAYTDIARGAGRILGVELSLNFDAPYLATSIADFWRRWHISFSTWLRDYIFLPLSLAWSRSLRGAVYWSLLVTFVASGIWHGANWTFIAWGLLHGIYLAAGLATRSLRDRLWGRRRGSRARRLVAQTMTFHLVCLSWVLFRSSSPAEALSIAKRVVLEAPALALELFSGSGVLSALVAYSRSELAGLGALSVVVLFVERAYHRPWLSRVWANNPRLRMTAYALLFYTIVFLGKFGETAFIYSQF